MKREGKEFSGRITPLFETMMVQPTQDEGVDSDIPADSLQTPITSQPSSSRTQKKHGEDNMQLSKLMLLCTNLQKQVLDLEKAKAAQAKEIANLKKRVQRLERKKKSRTTGLKRLKKVGMSSRVESSKDKESLVDDTQGRSDNEEMFDINDLHSDEVNADMPVEEKQEQSAKEREVDTNVEDTAKPKVVTIAATTTTTTRPKARGVVVHEPSEFRTPQESQLSMIKDKGKAIMIEPEVPLKRKDQVALDEDLARNLQAQLEAELIEEERIARKKEEEANIALIESWDNTQAMMEADFELAQRLQTEEQGEITIEKRSRLFVELINKRKKHFAMLRAEEKRRKPPTKAQKRNLLSTYLKNMGGYKHNQLKSKSYEEIQNLFDNDSKKKKAGESMRGEAKGSRKKRKEVWVIDREDLQTLWKLVKTKHGDTRPKDEHERVLWGDLKVMFEPDIKSDVWRNLQGYKVTIWKLFDSCGVHFVRFKSLVLDYLLELVTKMVIYHLFEDEVEFHSPSGRLPVPVVLIPRCPALPCKVSSLVAVETLRLGLVKPNSFIVGHLQLPSSILQESSCPHSQHSNVPP
ncbi:hypothetical protein Tco_0359136 [Tanacetum coccineum]